MEYSAKDLENYYLSYFATAWNYNVQDVLEEIEKEMLDEKSMEHN